MAETSTRVPDILEEDLSTFYDTHFSDASVVRFSEQFLGPVGESYEDEPEEHDDDDLGYYPDGVKRTLTNEQIAIFRHSEIESLLRNRRHAEEANNFESDMQTSTRQSEADDIEDGELEEDDGDANTPRSQTPTTSSSRPKATKRFNQKNSRKGRNSGEPIMSRKSFYKQNVKPDLRKRTWDKVDNGMESLAYDDEPAGRAAVPDQPSQRRKISYADD